MSRATASPKLDRTISLSDGRRLAYSEWGDLDGRPVVLINGTPASRLMCPDEEATEAAGVRLLTIDRPGYGGSAPRPGRTALDCVEDFVELADQLELPPVPVIGWSGGGPYALAMAARLPTRILAVGLAAAVGPLEHPGSPLLEIYSAEDRALIALLERDRAAGIAAIEERDAWFTAEGWEAMFAESWGPADDRVLADPTKLEALKGLTREAARQGSVGYVADEVAEYTLAGFSVGEIAQPVHIWCGEDDAAWARVTADHLATAIPRATLVLYPDEAHLFPFDHWAEMLTAVL